MTPRTRWPETVEQACASLRSALAADPQECRGCEELAFALGIALRKAGARGEDACRLLQDAIADQPPHWSQVRYEAPRPRERLMVAAVDAFYGVRPDWRSGMPSSQRSSRPWSE